MSNVMKHEKYLEFSRRYHRRFGTYNRIKKEFFRWYFRIYHRLEVRGVENIPDGPCIIAANHAGGYDLDLLALAHFAVPGREVTPMIIDSWHFLNSVWGRYYVGCGIPVWTGTGLQYEYIDPYLSPGGGEYPGIVAIFPEGNIPGYGDRHVLGKFYPGVVRMALRYRVPIIPAALAGFDLACPILKVIPHEGRPDDVVCLPFTLPFKCVVEFGKPVYLEKYYDAQLAKEDEFRLANEEIRPRLFEVLSGYGPWTPGPAAFPAKK